MLNKVTNYCNYLTRTRVLNIKTTPSASDAASTPPMTPTLMPTTTVVLPPGANLPPPPPLRDDLQFNFLHICSYELYKECAG